MHALGIPTTRALAVAATGEPVQRETTLPGAVLTRVAASHIRVGTFEFFASRGETEQVRKLAEYSIARHYPEIAEARDPFLALLEAVAARQAALIAQWMNVGFIHGVMNTDNMAISGETIDYGPCAFLEAYDPATVFSSIDQHGRYAFGNQPPIAQWNLTRLAEALLPLIDEGHDRAAALAMEVLNAFPAQYEAHLLQGQRAKLGLRRSEPDDDATDAALAAEWLALLQAGQVDFTLGWRRLSDAAAGDERPLRALFADGKMPDAWLARWRRRCAGEDRVADKDCGAGEDGGAGGGRGEGKDPASAGNERAEAMRRVNPFVIPRNHRVEEALAAASGQGDFTPFERLLDALKRPHDETGELAPYAEPAPAAATACYQTFCGT